MRIVRLLSLMALFCPCVAVLSAEYFQKDVLPQYNIVWDSASKTSDDSMPLSGYNLGLNVWVEPPSPGDSGKPMNGDIMILLASPNNLDENGMQVKLGLIRLKFDQPMFEKTIRQELRLLQSEIVISGQRADGSRVSVTLWCRSGDTVVHAQVHAEKPVGLTASYETWSSYQSEFKNGGIQWVRRLPEVNPRRLADMNAQGMKEFAKDIPDPLSSLTTGGRLDAAGMISAGSSVGKFNGMVTKICSVKTAVAVKQLDVTITLRMEQDKALAEWEAALVKDAKLASQDLGLARTKALAWWTAFWNRSHIAVKPAANTEQKDDKAWQAARNYNIVRYMLAANNSGRAMTLFNGGNYACSGNPDKRNWDFCQFMAQNQRLVYWPMLRSGDFDMLKVACDFYRDRTEMSRKHAKKFWNVDGVAYSEAFSIFGLDSIGTTKDGRCKARHLPYHHTSGIEFALMMIEYGNYFGKKEPGYLEPALGIISYYDQFYQDYNKKKTGKPLDEKGKIVIYPSDACEPYHGCKNNTDVIAGLMALTRELLALPSGAIPVDRREYVKGFQKRIPDFPIREKDGRKYYAGAESWEWVFENGNMDFPSMYICFPFTTLSLGRSDMSLAKNTWELSPVKASVQHQNQCWYQSAINFARMGETKQASRFTVDKLLHPGGRFPTFYITHYSVGGIFCHMPDTDHGGCSMSALQEMLMQCDGSRILLGPAWPAEWDCSFKLNAPYQTVVEGRVEAGQIRVDNITPTARWKDIVIFPLKAVVGPKPLSQGKVAKASSLYDGGYGPEKAFDGDSKTRWAVANGQKIGWLEVDLGESVEISRAVMEEISWPSVTKYAIETLDDAGQWKEVITGTKIGAQLELKFKPVKSQKFRLNIIEAGNMPNIEEFQLFEK